MATKTKSKVITLRLPTASKFAKLPLAKRAILFGKWLATQPKHKTYSYWDSTNCPLGQFASALAREEVVFGGGAYTVFIDGCKRIDIFPHSNMFVFALSRGGKPDKPSNPSRVFTFGTASKAFNRALVDEGYIKSTTR